MKSPPHAWVRPTTWTGLGTTWSLTEDSPLLDDSINRPPADQTHIGDVVAGLYGTEAGQAPTMLLGGDCDQATADDAE